MKVVAMSCISNEGPVENVSERKDSECQDASVETEAVHTERRRSEKRKRGKTEKETRRESQADKSMICK